MFEEVPLDADLIIFHSAVLNYLSSEDRRTFAAFLVEASKRRHIVWISNEAPHVVPEISSLVPRREMLRFLLGRTRLCNGRRQDELLALAHPHGSDLEWLSS